MYVLYYFKKHTSFQHNIIYDYGVGKYVFNSVEIIFMLFKNNMTENYIINFELFKNYYNNIETKITLSNIY